MRRHLHGTARTGTGALALDRTRHLLTAGAAVVAALAGGATVAQGQPAATGGATPVAAAASPPATVSAAPGCTASSAELQRRLSALHYAVGQVDGCDGPATRAAVQAFQKAQGLAADGVAGPVTRRALRSPARPAARSNAPGRHAEVSISRQLLLLVRDGRVERIFAATTGMPGYDTPAGSYRVVRKESRSWSGEYNVWMPWASYFDGARGLAIHAGDVQPQPASHGCVRVPAVFAEQIYAALPLSTAIIVR